MQFLTAASIARASWQPGCLLRIYSSLIASTAVEEIGPHVLADRQPNPACPCPALTFTHNCAQVFQVDNGMFRQIKGDSSWR